MNTTMKMTRKLRKGRLSVSVSGALLVLLPSIAVAQHAQHEDDAHEHADPAPAQQQQPHSAHQAHQEHQEHRAPAATDEAPVDHATMGHGADAGDEGHATMDHASMDHSMHGAALPADAPPREPIPAVSSADRVAAFPDVHGHAVHDKAIHSFWLADRLEAWDEDDGTAFGWEGLAWVGTDTNRLWLRTEGEHVGGSVESADIEVFHGRAIARWWDLLAGVRHDFGDAPSQTWAAIGVTGLAPYKFEVDATAYLGSGGQTAAVLEAEYDTLLTNRLILQWVAEAEFHGKDDPRRGIGEGLGTVEAGLRLRYEFTRRFAPYVGVVRERAFGGTADLRRADGHDIDDTRFVIGVRTWF
ncbi:copper resistance protein B [Luteimonas pelagia]